MNGPRGPFANTRFNASCPSVYIEQVQDRESIKNLVNSYDWSGELEEQEIIIINKPENVSLPFVEYPIGTRHSNSIGTYDLWTPSFFDGVTCRDNNMVFESNSRDSYISVDSAPLNGALSGNLTVEFWIKIADDKWDVRILRNKNILSLTDAVS